jgi:hypothetical protein
VKKRQTSGIWFFLHSKRNNGQSEREKYDRKYLQTTYLLKGYFPKYVRNSCNVIVINKTKS